MRIELVVSDETPGHVPMFSITMTEEDCAELSFGRVPALVQENAKRLVDWTQEDLRKNAAKPVRKGRQRAVAAVPEGGPA